MTQNEPTTPSRIYAQAARVSREQAHSLGQHPELLARMVDMLTRQVEARVAESTGHPDEYIDVLIVAELRVLLPEEGVQA